MLIVHQKAFNKGMVLGISFLVVLGIMFSPVFGEGRNAFRASDDFFNSIAKGSTNYMDKLTKENEKYKGRSIDAALAIEDQETLQRASELFSKAGAAVSMEGGQLTVKGDLGQIFDAVVEDSKVMFYNKGDAIQAKYGFDPRAVMITWHKSFKALNKALTKQEMFKEAAALEEVMKRGIEVAYNFYTIEPTSASSRVGMLSFSLLFYVLYTLWWGYAILLTFDGLGLEMKAGKKKEV